jgi:hypothetical protein
VSKKEPKLAAPKPPPIDFDDEEDIETFPSSLYDILELNDEIGRLQRELSAISAKENANGEAIIMRNGRPMSKLDFSDLIADLEGVLVEIRSTASDVYNEACEIEQSLKRASQ